MAVSSLVRESIEFILSASLLPVTVLAVVSATVSAVERGRFLTKTTNLGDKIQKSILLQESGRAYETYKLTPL